MCGSQDRAVVVVVVAVAAAAASADIETAAIVCCHCFLQGSTELQSLLSLSDQSWRGTYRTVQSGQCDVNALVKSNETGSRLFRSKVSLEGIGLFFLFVSFSWGGGGGGWLAGWLFVWLVSLVCLLLLLLFLLGERLL